MGTAELFVGLTEKAIELETAARASFKEMITEISPEGKVRTEKGALEALKRRFDGLWLRAGIRRSLLIDAVMGDLMDAPKTLAEILDSLKNDPEDEFKDLDIKAVVKTVRALLDAGLLTDDPDKIWVME